MPMSAARSEVFPRERWFSVSEIAGYLGVKDVAP